MSDILVVGCGIIGLTTAIRLQEAGHRVTIRAEQLPPDTTSNVAAAIWYPFGVKPPHRVSGWAAKSSRVFMEDHRVGQRGVSKLDGVLLFKSAPPRRKWSDFVLKFHGEVAENEHFGYAHAYLVTTWLIEMDTYLNYLMSHFLAPDDSGLKPGTIEGGHSITSLDSELARYRVVVNCAGWKAAALAADDQEAYPARGQIIIVPRQSLREPPERFYLDENPDELTYIVPRMNDCVLGGTYEKFDSDTTPREDTAHAIRNRCAKFSGEAAMFRPEDRDRVGIRPGRSEVRLEVLERAGGLVAHNYGHGGAGITLCWGCADDMRDEIAAKLNL